ncbi:proton-coupled folate transporter-like [Stegodyphus dumicola]|uniref:proton-coupled folate transporter-like n=1 Tax=Stegodyphus dumicola TaxID=202533 RepID=UPI0015AE3437|nr:proton-coupled folate transporter-like [Stegodyphus dumicola]XP_035233693.1 proton-coupled folate transporter-like [Stegodyphus dumicola]
MDEKITQPTVKTPLKNDDCSIQYGGFPEQQNASLLKTDSFSTQNEYPRGLRTLKSLTIEPVFFCFMFAYMLNVSCLTNMMMDKGCLYKLNYSSIICQNLSAHKDEKENVEILANNYALYSNLMSFIGALTMTFIAPWSDKYGRKPPLLMSLIGSILSDIGLLLCTVHFDSRLEYILLSKIPAELFGGFICVLTIVYSHASEVSSGKRRTLKYTFIEIAMGLGMSLGSFSGGLLYRYCGYFYIYATSMAFHLFCVPWVIFVMEETTGLESDVSWPKKFRDIFAIENLTKGIAACIRPRENYNRCLLLLLFASMCTIVLTYEAFASVGYVYVHHIYDWDQFTYSMITTIFMFSQMVIAIIVTPILIRVYKVTDTALGLTGTLSMMLKNLIIAFAEWRIFLYYIGNVVGFVTPFSTLSVRSAISKILDKDEFGRVFSFLATCEAILPMAGTIAVTKVFNATIDVFPSVSYLMTVGLLIIPLGTFSWARSTSKRSYGFLKDRICGSDESTKPLSEDLHSVAQPDILQNC